MGVVFESRRLRKALCVCQPPENGTFLPLWRAGGVSPRKIRYQNLTGYLRRWISQKELFLEFKNLGGWKPPLPRAGGSRQNLFQFFEKQRSAAILAMAAYKANTEA